MSKLPMNLPNRITIARILLIPLYLLLLALVEQTPNWYAAFVFVIAASTDWLDGLLARKRGEVTDFGKFMDPIADKLLVLTPMIVFVGLGTVNVWAVVLMVSREVIVSGFRLVAASKGSVIAADKSGKLKTVIQVLAVFLLTIGADVVGAVVAWIAAVLSVYSGIEMIVRNRAVLEETE